MSLTDMAAARLTDPVRRAEIEATIPVSPAGDAG